MLHCSIDVMRTAAKYRQPVGVPPPGANVGHAANTRSKLPEACPSYVMDFSPPVIIQMLNGSGSRLAYQAPEQC